MILTGTIPNAGGYSLNLDPSPDHVQHFIDLAKEDEVPQRIVHFLGIARVIAEKLTDDERDVWLEKIADHRRRLL